PDAAARGAWAFTELVRRIAELPEPRPRLWCLTRGVRDAVDAAALGQAPLWGLGRIAATEHPEFWGGVVDVPAGPLAADRLVDLFAAPPAEPLLALDASGDVRVPRLVTAAPRGAEPFVCRPDGTYLITGGLGVLGLVLAEHLAARGARRLVLLGRSPLPSRATWTPDDPRVRAIGRLEAAGVSVLTVAADVTDRTGLRRALDRLQLPPIRGIVHAAGVVHGDLLRRLDDRHLQEVLAPKVAGAWVLHELFPPGSLDFLVLFSSAGPLLGLPGQGAYAAANTFLDVLAAHRRTAESTSEPESGSGPAAAAGVGTGTGAGAGAGGGAGASVSLAWTSWRGLGMATAGDTTDLELAARGTTSISPDEALRAFDQTVGSPSAAPMVAVLGVSRGHTGPRPALLAEVAPAETTAPRDVPDWVGLRGHELTDHLLGIVGGRVAAVLGTDVSALDPHQPLTEAGVDSLLSASIRIALERELGLALPATLLWNHRTVLALAAYLTTLLSDTADTEVTLLDQGELVPGA
ncbi:beta-ketoacyl reductase, partial [Candidatus Frankia nodulisporulans]